MNKLGNIIKPFNNILLRTMTYAHRNCASSKVMDYLMTLYALWLKTAHPFNAPWHMYSDVNSSIITRTKDQVSHLIGMRAERKEHRNNNSQQKMAR